MSGEGCSNVLPPAPEVTTVESEQPLALAETNPNWESAAADLVNNGQLVDPNAFCNLLVHTSPHLT